MANTATALLDATTDMLAPLLNALDSLQFAGRHLHPPLLATLAEHLQPLIEPLSAAHAAFRGTAWPEHLTEFAKRLDDAATNTLASIDGIVNCTELDNPVIGAYRALRKSGQARAALYPLCAVLPPIGRFFLTPEARQDAALTARLASPAETDAQVGVMHLNNAAHQRGGYSIYVPEYYSGEPLPLVVALHGGSGHGADFLWTWLVAARSSGAILLSPTSTDGTWSLQDPETDHKHIQKLVANAAEQWAIDEQHMLLTGMSDGGTFTLLSGLQSDSFATHLAPISGAFHPFLLEVAEPGRIRELPVYLVHGALDWMFPVDTARLAASTLSKAGIDLQYVELEDLSHCYPVEQNSKILEWLVR